MLSLVQLKYFAQAAALGSIARAAQVLHVTPSAISQAIIALERELGLELTTHQRNTFSLTFHGKMLAERSKSLLLAEANLRSEIMFAAGIDAGELDFMTQQSIAATILPGALSLLKKRAPRVQVNLKIGIRPQVFQAVKTRTTNFGITVNLKPSQQFQRESLLTGRYVLITGGRQSFPEATALVADANTPDILRLKSLYEAKFGHKLNVGHQLTSWTVCVEMAAAGLGVAFVPEYVLLRTPKKNFRVLRWPFSEPEIEYAIEAVWPAAATLGALPRRFLDIFRESTASDRHVGGG